MLNKFAYFAMIISVLGILASIGEPFLIRTKTRLEFRHLGIESAADHVASAELRTVVSDLASSFALSVTGVFLSSGLLHRREWASRLLKKWGEFWSDRG